MTTFYITFRQYRVATVEAESESAARQSFIDWSFDDIEDGAAVIVDIEEAQ